MFAWLFVVPAEKEEKKNGLLLASMIGGPGWEPVGKWMMGVRT